MRGISIFSLFLIPIYLFLPVFILYVTIKLAVKNAVKDNAQMEDIVQLWTHRFNKNFKTTNCDQLRGLDEQGELASCDPLILEAADILELTSISSRKPCP